MYLKIILKHQERASERFLQPIRDYDISEGVFDYDISLLDVDESPKIERSRMKAADHKKTNS